MKNKKNTKTHNKLRERIKELNCLYGLSKLIERSSISLEEIFQEMVFLIPPAWQYSDVTCVRIVFKDKEYKTDDFKMTKWKQSSDIKAGGKKSGVLEVYYLKDRPRSYEGPFMKEERNLIDAIAERLGGIIERKTAVIVLQKQKKDLEQKNIALSEILGQIEIEKKQLKDNVILNVEEFVLPIIEKLRIKNESLKHVKLLRKNLKKLTSSFGRRLTEKSAKLSPREIEICNMIKNGLTSKEISGMLSISILTVERHRFNVRKKLGLVKQGLNLTTFLKTL